MWAAVAQHVPNFTTMGHDNDVYGRGHTNVLYSCAVIIQLTNARVLVFIHCVWVCVCVCARQLLNFHWPFAIADVADQQQQHTHPIILHQSKHFSTLVSYIYLYCVFIGIGQGKKHTRRLSIYQWCVCVCVFVRVIYLYHVWLQFYRHASTNDDDIMLTIITFAESEMMGAHTNTI